MTDLRTLPLPPGGMFRWIGTTLYVRDANEDVNASYSIHSPMHKYAACCMVAMAWEHEICKLPVNSRNKEMIYSWTDWRLAAREALEGLK